MTSRSEKTLADFTIGQHVRYVPYQGARMNIYTAIMMAAKHIERYPQEFDFNSVIVPPKPNRGTPGCALGWIGAFAKVHHEWCTSISLVAAEEAIARRDSLLQIGPLDFYSRMDAISGSTCWRQGAVECARNLRLYAQKYHAPVIAPPNWRVIMASPLIPEHAQSEDATHV